MPKFSTNKRRIISKDDEEEKAIESTPVRSNRRGRPRKVARQASPLAVASTSAAADSSSSQFDEIDEVLAYINGDKRRATALAYRRPIIHWKVCHQIPKMH